MNGKMTDSFKNDARIFRHNANTAYWWRLKRAGAPKEAGSLWLCSLNSAQSPCLRLSTYPFPISPLSKIIIFILGASRGWFFSSLFISHRNLLSHVDWHAGFMSFIALLTCNPIRFISQCLDTPPWSLLPLSRPPSRSEDTAGHPLQFKGWEAEGVILWEPSPGWKATARPFNSAPQARRGNCGFMSLSVHHLLF